jgi:hypothetical protein
MEASLTHDVFTQHINTKFHVKTNEDANVELELIQVSELTVRPRQEEFSLVFCGPSDTFLGQGVHSFRHDQMGQFDLFIVPIQQDELGFHYEAVFNRFLE